MTRKFGFQRLAEQAVASVEEQMLDFAAYMEARPDQGSPIESLLYCAMHVHDFFNKRRADAGFVSARGNLEEEKKSNQDDNVIIYERQKQIDGVGRVDFVFHSQKSANREWQSLIVECDGHEFHERTKEQAAKDKSRDRAATLAGYAVFRFTGSEVWGDPWGCVDQIRDWARKGWDANG